MRNLRRLLREADEKGPNPFGVEGTGWFGITSIPTTRDVTAKFPTALKSRYSDEEVPEPEPAAPATQDPKAAVAAAPEAEDEEDDGVVTTFSIPQATEPAEEEGVAATQAAPAAAPEEEDDGEVTTFSLPAATEPESAPDASQAQAQTTGPSTPAGAPAPSAPEAAQPPPQATPPETQPAPAGTPDTPAPAVPTDDPAAPPPTSTETPVDSPAPTPAEVPAPQGAEPAQQAETPVSPASIKCEEILKLSDVEMWDLLSFRSPGTDGTEDRDYRIAEKVQIAFDSRPPSSYQIENFRALFDDMGINCSIQYPGRRLMMSTLMTQGSCSKTVLRLTKGNKDASAFDGLCMFVECILSRELKQNGFYP